MSSKNSERLVASNAKYKVVACEHIDDDLAEALWGKNQSGFSELNSSSVARQNMTREEFYQDIASAQVHKYIVFSEQAAGQDDRTASAIGMLFVYADAREVAWINQPYMRHNLAGFNEGKYVYISTIVIEQGHRGTEASALLIRAVGEDLGDSNSALMDFAGANDRLPHFIQRVFDSDQYSGKRLLLDLSQIGQEDYLLADPINQNAPAPNEHADITRTVGAEQAEAFWQEYSKRTSGLEAQYPVRQALNHDEFISYCANPQITKAVIEQYKNRSREVLFLSRSSKLSEHLSSEFITAKSDGRNFLYLLGSGAMNDVADNPYVEAGLSLLLGLTRKSQAVLAYNADHSASKLRQALCRLSGMDVREIDHQSYWVCQPRIRSRGEKP